VLAYTIMTSSAVLAQDADTAKVNDDNYKFRLGGYGEMLAQRKDYGTNRFYGGADGNTKINRSSISIPRFVLAMDYRFNRKWELGAEIEFESGGVGSAMELENTENGEYETETEKGGEVAIEQFHITRRFLRELNFRFGHIIVPVGLTNAHHEPVNFFGTVRPEGETTILPSTWHENGVEIFGSIGKSAYKFDYQFQLIEGLNANGFDRNTWVAGGKQGIFEEDNFTCPAIVSRIDYKGIPGMRIGFSHYFCNDAGKNADKYQTYSSCGKATVNIITADIQYKSDFVIFRANIVDGNLASSSDISKKNIKLSSKSPYTRVTPIASKAVSYGAEAGLRLNAFPQNPKFPDLVPFVRYEYYNPQEQGEADQVMDPRLKTSMLVAGINYHILPGLVAKFDYTTRTIGGGDYNSENEFAIGLAYVGWFFKK